MYNRSAVVTVGFFGGSFNPPHVAHVLAAAYALSAHALDRLVVVPCYDHPLGKHLAPFVERAAMCERAFGVLRGVEVSPIEQELGATSRTLYTLQALKERNPDWSLRLVIGSDILHETDKWFRWDEIVKLAPPIVLGRAGHDHPDGPLAVLPPVASRDIRAALARGDLRPGLLPLSVERYIAERGLYRDAT
ncbi:MAG: nicotinate-nicotinamide nucleotide adenylyltransferase [Polyangiales bacterium]